MTLSFKLESVKFVKRFSRMLHPPAYLFGLRGDMSIAGPGAGMSMGNISTHISIRPFGAHRNKIKCYVSFLFFFTVTPKSAVFPLPVRFRVCQDSARVWSPRVQVRACSPPAGSPPSGSAPSEPDAPRSASSDLRDARRAEEERLLAQKSAGRPEVLVSSLRAHGSRDLFILQFIAFVFQH